MFTGAIIIAYPFIIDLYNGIFALIAVDSKKVMLVYTPEVGMMNHQLLDVIQQILESYMYADVSKCSITYAV